MSTMLTDQIYAALAEFSSASRLYELQIGDGKQAGLLVEAFVAEDGVQEVGARDVSALSTDAGLALDDLLGQPAALISRVGRMSCTAIGWDGFVFAFIGRTVAMRLACSSLRLLKSHTSPPTATIA